MRCTTLALALLMLCSCEPGVIAPLDSGDTDTDTDTDSDTDADTDADADADTDTDTDCTIMEPTDPVYDASFGGEDWSGEPGYWFTSGSTSYLVADHVEQQVNLEVRGDLTECGSYEVGAVLFTDTIASDNYDFFYRGQAGDDVRFTVLGISEDEEWIWGELSGTVPLTDAMKLEPDTTLDVLTVQSWPRF